MRDMEQKNILTIVKQIKTEDGENAVERAMYANDVAVKLAELPSTAKAVVLAGGKIVPVREVVEYKNNKRTTVAFLLDE